MPGSLSPRQLLWAQGLLSPQLCPQEQLPTSRVSVRALVAPFPCQAHTLIPPPRKGSLAGQQRTGSGMRDSFSFCSSPWSCWIFPLRGGQGWGFPGGSDDQESACNAGNPGSIPELGSFPGEGNGYPLHHSCLENAMDRGAWRATVRGVTESQTGLSN